MRTTRPASNRHQTGGSSLGRCGRGRVARLELVGRWRLHLTALVAGVLVAAGAAAQSDDRQREYTVKAAYLYNFAKFVDWPDEDLTPAPIRFCVLGDDPFGKVFDAIANETAKGRTLVVERFAGVAGIERCHVLFISDNQRPQLDLLLRRLDGHSVLTVSDMRGFARAGGMVGFVNRRNNVRLEINLQAAHGAGLRVSAKLLEVSELILGNQP